MAGWLDKLFKGQEENAMGADYAFAAPEVKAAVENNTPEGKALIAKDVETTKNGKTMDEKFAPNTTEIKAAQESPNNPYSAFTSGKDVKPEYSAVKNPDQTGAGDVFDTESYLNNLRNRYDSIEDYYKNSMSDSLSNLGDVDKKILLFDALGTLAKNVSKYRLPMYSAYGKSYEGHEMGNEKSMLEEGLRNAYSAGMDRRNKRLDNQLNQQLEVANFPSNLQMKIQSELSSGRVSNKTKMEMLDILGDMSLSHAAKISLIQGVLNTNPVEKAMNIGSKLF